MAKETMLNKLRVVFGVAMLLLLFPKLSLCAEAKYLDPIEWGKMQAGVFKADPKTITEEQFYSYEDVIIRAYSGSGGASLGEEQIAWIKKMEASFIARGIHLKDPFNRHSVMADSYYNAGKYAKALDEYRLLKDQPQIETMEWLVKNGSLKDGKVILTEYPGPIPDTMCGDDQPKAENDKFLFESCFKGPIYRYNKLTKMHTVIYVPEAEIEWGDKLIFDGKELIITLRLNSGVFRFNNETLRINLISNGS